MNKPLLIEIGVEELPAIPFLKELPNIKDKWKKILKENTLLADIELFFTPRRIVLWHKEFPLKQEEQSIELFGPPLDIAYKDGVPTNAALGFAKKCGVDLQKIKHIKKSNKEILYYQKMVEAKESKELLQEMLDKFLKSLNFGKSMRWGSLNDEFIRPIRWLCVMLGDEVVDLKLYGINSSNISYPHRFISYDPYSHSGGKDYFKKLEQNGVIVDPKKREQIILEQFKEIEKSSGFKIEIDKQLLDEVVAITENPHALLGSFEKEFLKLPDEVIILSMREHQRYFPLFDKNRLTNHFVVVSNALCNDFSKIIKGNEKVLRARLSDAIFFYENDIKKGLDSEGLKEISFIDKGGSLYDKLLREQRIANYLNKSFDTNIDNSTINRVFELKNADLLTDMVYEFTELQGIMGYYYAKEMGEDEKIAIAIKEQYLPDGENSELPSSDLSSIVALSYKLDTLLKLFSLNMIPTGTKDPFGLRRAVIGIIRIVIDRGYSFDIKSIIDNLSKEYDGVDANRVIEFFLDRIMQYFDANPSIIRSVLDSGERDILKISKKIDALNSIISKSDFKSYSSTFKRVANIIKDMDKNRSEINKELLSEAAEIDLYDAYIDIVNKEYNGYQDRLEALFSLKPQIDRFFDDVMVNVDDDRVKQNRKSLINNIYLEFKEIADIKEIAI